MPSTYATHTMTVSPDIKKIIEDTIKEGCVEETVSALEAWREMREEDDLAVRNVLEKVVEDEAHHAAYAWKVVRWAIEREGLGKVDQQLVELLESIVTPAGLEKVGKGRYTQEDITLLCNLKDSLLSHYKRNEKGNEMKNSYCERADNKVSSMVMQVVC